MGVTAMEMPTVLFWATVKVLRRNLKGEKLAEGLTATGNTFHKLAAFRKK